MKLGELGEQRTKEKVFVGGLVSEAFLPRWSCPAKAALVSAP